MAALASAARDRILPGRLFEKFTALDLPPEAWIIGHGYDQTRLEQHLSLAFSASPAEIRKFLQALGTSSTTASGVEVFSDIPVRGDHRELRVNWEKGLMIFKFLDV